MKTKIYAHCNSNEIKYCGTGKVNKDRFPLVRITEQADYVITIYKDGAFTSGVVSVPVDFEMDGASIPTVAHFYYQPLDPRILRAAAIHDYLYTTSMFKDRAIVDEIFFQILLQKNPILEPTVHDALYTAIAASPDAEEMARAHRSIPLRDARIMWAAVRIGGAKAWNTIEPCILEDRALQPAATNPWTGGYTTFNEYLDYTDYQEIIVK